MEKLMRNKTMLASLCEGMLKANADLYLKHELMLEEEKVERGKLGEQFQERMVKINEQLSSNKERR